MKKTAHILPKRRIRETFNRAVHEYDSAANLQRQVGQYLLQLLPDELINLQRVLEVGSGTGFLTASLQQQLLPIIDFNAIDIAYNMVVKTRERLGAASSCQVICADADHLPFTQNYFDLLITNLVLQWSNNLQTTFTEYYRVLNTNGTLLFSTFGPHTLHELRQSWTKVDAGIHVNHFFSAMTITENLERVGFYVNSVQVERVQLFFPNVLMLMRNLKALGAHNINQGRAVGLMGKHKLQQLMTAYEVYRQQELPASYEVIYVVAKKLR